MGGTFDEVLPGFPGSQYAACSWNGVRGSGGTCTLLGPEGPDALQPCRGWELTDLWAFFCCRLVLVAGVGTARTLRTTQWTRAS